MKFKQFHEMAKKESRIPLKQAQKLAKEIITKIGLKYVDPSSIKENTKGKRGLGIPVGSVRREKTDIGDIDILSTKKLTAKELEKVTDVDQMWSRGENQVFFDYYSPKLDIERSVNIWYLKDMDSFGAMMVFTTGPQEHNITLRSSAKKQGLKANRYGIFRDNIKIGGETEGSYYNSIITKKDPQGKSWKPPQERRGWKKW